LLTCESIGDSVPTHCRQSAIGLAVRGAIALLAAVDDAIATPTNNRVPQTVGRAGSVGVVIGPVVADFIRGCIGLYNPIAAMGSVVDAAHAAIGRIGVAAVVDGVIADFEWRIDVAITAMGRQR